MLNGEETSVDLEALGKDIFTYFGLGCRNVSKLYVPENYNFDSLFKSFDTYSSVAVNHKYVNNYDYNKSIYLVNREAHFDNGFVLLKESQNLSSPISVVFFEYYRDEEELNSILKNKSEETQCIVSKSDVINNSIRFGQSQQPELWDYADGIDTLDFLLNLELKKK